MNWNNNDTKYIIKRILLYLIITSIVFFAGQRCAKAAVLSQSIQNHSTFIQTNDNSLVGTTWKVGSTFSSGQGYIIFNIIAQAGSGNGQTILREVYLHSSSNDYLCDLGNSYTYYDNTTQQRLYTANCSIKGIGETLEVYLKSYGGEATNYYISDFATYVTELSDANSIVSGISSTLVDQITRQIIDNGVTQDLIRGTNSALQQQTTAITNASQQEISAIGDNTQAINDLNDTIQADLDPTIPTDFMDGIDGLFTNTDDNVIRQLLMLPLNLFVIVYNALTSNSCSAISLGTLYGVNLSLPCIYWKNYVGNGFYIIIDTIFGCVLTFGLYRYAKHVLNSAFNLSDKATEAVEVFK